MDEALLRQLAELAKAFNGIGVKPVICGGLGVYLCFYKSEGAARNMIRATNDIDLMLTKSQVMKMSRREAIAEMVSISVSRKPLTSNWIFWRNLQMVSRLREIESNS